MRAILIPVKDFSQAKQRLAPVLPKAERVTLAQAMMEDVFSVVAETRGVDCVFVATSNLVVLERAQSLGWETIRESHQISESDSVDSASRSCAARGVEALLRLPSDIPLVEPGDIEVLFEQLQAPPSMVIVPSRDGTGTNALLRTPPALFPSHFGPNSFAKHLGEAEKCAARIQVLRNPRLELDVDDPSDLQALLSAASRIGPATAAWLAVQARRRGATSFRAMFKPDVI